MKYQHKSASSAALGSTARFRYRSTIMRKVLVLLILSCNALSPAVADDSYKLYLGAYDAKSRDGRIKFGREVLAEVQRFGVLLRSPSPSEEEWVKAEQASIDKLTDATASLARTVQFTESPELQQVKMYHYIVAVGNALGCAVDPSVKLKQEILC